MQTLFWPKAWLALLLGIGVLVALWRGYFHVRDVASGLEASALPARISHWWHLTSAALPPPTDCYVPKTPAEERIRNALSEVGVTGIVMGPQHGKTTIAIQQLHDIRNEWKAKNAGGVVWTAYILCAEGIASGITRYFKSDESVYQIWEELVTLAKSHNVAQISVVLDQIDDHRGEMSEADRKALLALGQIASRNQDRLKLCVVALGRRSETLPCIAGLNGGLKVRSDFDCPSHPRVKIDSLINMGNDQLLPDARRSLTTNAITGSLQKLESTSRVQLRDVLEKYPFVSVAKLLASGEGIQAAEQLGQTMSRVVHIVIDKRYTVKMTVPPPYCDQRIPVAEFIKSIDTTQWPPALEQRYQDKAGAQDKADAHRVHLTEELRSFRRIVDDVSFNDERTPLQLSRITQPVTFSLNGERIKKGAIIPEVTKPGAKKANLAMMLPTSEDELNQVDFFELTRKIANLWGVQSIVVPRDWDHWKTVPNDPVIVRGDQPVTFALNAKRTKEGTIAPGAKEATLDLMLPTNPDELRRLNFIEVKRQLVDAWGVQSIVVPRDWKEWENAATKPVCIERAGVWSR